MISKNSNTIKLSKRHPIEYEVNFTSDLLNPFAVSPLSQYITKRKLLVVVDSKVLELYGQKIEKYFKAFDCEFKLIPLNALEKNKTMTTISEICQVAKDFQMKRDSFFIGIGGGITLDLVGFAAFMFRRKTRYIRIPTTLLGLVDAGVGIKVGANFDNAKNLVGGYYAPFAVFIDQSFLQTLDIPNIRCGLYEIIKMGVINNKKLFNLVESRGSNFLTKKFDNNTDKIIYLSILSMMKELEPNLHENNLKRSVDFGHTFSTYIEESSGYSINHGEAVGLDILISSFISLRRKVLSQGAFDRIYTLIKSIGFTKMYKLPSMEKFCNALDLVRNHRAGNLNLVLPTKIGSCAFTNDCSKEELEEAVLFCRDFIEWKVN